MEQKKYYESLLKIDDDDNIGDGGYETFLWDPNEVGKWVKIMRNLRDGVMATEKNM